MGWRSRWIAAVLVSAACGTASGNDDDGDGSTCESRSSSGGSLETDPSTGVDGSTSPA
ncbi:MAG: hypothetical protein IAG13_04775 [Deltaproteobacteria bacterium]|nr:hypothetical protein [Nannocystaceae bacterium]